MSAPARLSWNAVCARRLARHLLAVPDPDARPVDAARVMCGAHAQVMSAAEISIAMRTAAATRSTVRDAVWTEKSLIKTRGVRGTVHLLPAADLPLWCGALSAVPTGRFTRADPAGLDVEQADQVVAGIAAVLEDAELTADELTAALADRVGGWAADPVMEGFQTVWPRWYHAMDVAMHRGAMCFGPGRGRKVTYTGPGRWLPGFRPAGGEAALGWLVRQYLHAYGPATAPNFAQWLAAPPAWAASLFTSLGDALRPVTVQGVTAWENADDPGPPALPPPAGVRLLPYFDGYAVGGRPRELLFPGPAAKRALAGGQAGNYPVLLVDGVVAGVWHQRRSGTRIAVTVEPLDPLSPARLAELDHQVQRLGEILEGRPVLTLGPVTVGPHA
ncbi:winged helix DNA-binding domain-containing protein [Actinoplanes aureus]|uniref:AlkZ family DNA glycosylase n=1 Tax=Actinoplanes aureus TaxID=2792083 RepID=A0A931CI86_9ACTN|nr:winged helix DNA-binding domain-containing protein [Actinoplanes aureus]MBG0568487.1 AlkZ family DNA glycosylase [Actinoplanes aureus]